MLSIGLTGGIGSGKTTVAKLFADLGVPVIDTDVISHQLTNTDEVLKEIQCAFGSDALLKDGSLNRKQLASIVFADTAAKQQLETILHPRIRQQTFERVNAISDRAYVIIVVPLLLETDFHTLVDRILVVDADEQTQMQRVQQRDNRSKDEIQQILNSQTDRQSRLCQADEVIDNNGHPDQLKLAVQALHEKYLELSQGR